MSTEVYTGFRLHADPLEFVGSIWEPLSRVRERLDARELVGRGANIYDGVLLGLSRDDEALGRTPLEHAYSALRRQEAQTPSDYLSNPHRFTLQVSKDPVTGDVLGRTITLRKAYDDIVPQGVGYEAWPYWDGVEGPADIPTADWHARRDAWWRTFDGNNPFLEFRLFNPALWGQIMARITYDQDSRYDDVANAEIPEHRQRAKSILSNYGTARIVNAGNTSLDILFPRFFTLTRLVERAPESGEVIDQIGPLLPDLNLDRLRKQPMAPGEPDLVKQVDEILDEWASSLAERFENEVA